MRLLGARWGRWGERFWPIRPTRGERIDNWCRPGPMRPRVRIRSPILNELTELNRQRPPQRSHPPTLLPNQIRGCIGTSIRIPAPPFNPETKATIFRQNLTYPSSQTTSRVEIPPFFSSLNYAPVPLIAEVQNLVRALSVLNDYVDVAMIRSRSRNTRLRWWIEPGPSPPEQSGAEESAPHDGEPGTNQTASTSKA
jgi:hypothetical protein